MTDETKNDNIDENESYAAEKNRRDLLKKLHAANKRLEEFEAAEAERETEAARKAGDFEKLLKAEQENASKVQKALTEKLAAAEARNSALQSQTAIDSVLRSADIDPQFADVVALMLQYNSGLTITEDGARFGDKAPADFAQEFFADKGKKFLKPVINSGGGSKGNLGGGSKSFTGEQFSYGKYQTLCKENPALGAQYASDTGNGYLNK